MKQNSIWIFNHYAQGPNLPGGTRHYDLSLEFIKKGYDVTIFASGFHHALLKNVIDFNNESYCIENIDGVRFIWIKTSPYKKNGLKRMINIFSFALRLNYIIPKLNIPKPNFIIGSTVHPLSSLVAKRLASKYKAKFIFEIRDLWPQTFIDMNLWKPKSLTSIFFFYLEKITVKSSYKIVVLSPLTIDYLADRYQFPKEKIQLLPNGVNSKLLSRTKTENIERPNNKIIITYLGGIDKVHGLEFLIELAGQLNNNKDIVFNIYGDGKEKENLKKLCSENSITNVDWKGSVPKSEVPKALSKATLLFVSTSNVLYGSENKLYDYMANSKPIILAIHGEHNNPVKEIGCGLTLDRDNLNKSVSDLERFIKTRFNDFDKIGEKGFNYVSKNRTTTILANKLIDFLNV